MLLDSLQPAFRRVSPLLGHSSRLYLSTVRRVSKRGKESVSSEAVPSQNVSRILRYVIIFISITTLQLVKVVSLPPSIFPILTRDPLKLTPSDFLSVPNGTKSQGVRYRQTAALPATYPNAQYSTINGPRKTFKYPFPEGTQGFLYFHHSHDHRARECEPS